MEKMSKTGPVALRRSPGFSMPLPIPMVNTPTEDQTQYKAFARFMSAPISQLWSQL